MSRLTILSVAIGCALCWQPTPALCKEAKPAAAPVLTLQQAVELAMQNNRPLKTATLEVEKAQDATDAARTRRYPALNVLGISGSRLSESKFEFNQGAFGTFPGIGPVPGANTEIKEPARWSTFVQASPSSRSRRSCESTKASGSAR